MLGKRTFLPRWHFSRQTIIDKPWILAVGKSDRCVLSYTACELYRGTFSSQAYRC